MAEDNTADPGQQSPEEDRPDGDDSLADDPGRPRGKDELDPELLRLSKPRTQVNWLMSLSIVVLCGYLLFRVHPDFSFSREGESATTLDTTAAIQSAELDSYVSVPIKPDRGELYHAKRGADLGRHLMPALGQGDNLWLLTSAGSWQDDNPVDDVYTGRVRRLGDLPLYDALTERLAERPPSKRGVSLDELRAAAKAKQSTTAITDLFGDTLPLTADTQIEVVHRVVNRAVIVASADYGELDDDFKWRTALSAAGIMSSSVEPIHGTGETWTYVVEAADGVDALRKRLADAKLFGARAKPYEQRSQGSFASLSIDGGSMSIGDDEVPLSAVQSVTVAVRHRAPADARVLIHGETPEQYWYMWPIVLLLTLVGLLFLWALIRALRGPLPPTAASAAA